MLFSKIVFEKLTIVALVLASGNDVLVFNLLQLVTMCLPPLK